ncbi:MAG: protein phosphatase CheZ [Gammaproteobacteria bacterium]|nr:protein phosphatase CheZ [Gammaproteobacteria bacterium]NVK89583.1 protein phosphatase CheZ [Gammaproteobacteria bacterium]
MADVTLEQAKHLLDCLEEGNIQAARETIDSLSQIREASLFCEVGKLTRQLHEALANFQLDDKIAGLAAQEIPDAKDRLNYVIETTENAANKTMDSVEQCLPISENIRDTADNLLGDWERLYRRELKPGEFRELASRVEEFLKSVGNDSTELNKLLTDVLVAQDYQDLTGQVIRKVITLVQDVEENLVDLVKMFGRTEDFKRAQNETKKVTGAEGPVIDKNRDDVLTNQDDVDDLLSSLGF